MKSYKLTKGNCTGSCLCKECETNVQGIKKFLISLGLECKDNHKIEVVND